MYEIASVVFFPLCIFLFITLFAFASGSYFLKKYTHILESDPLLFFPVSALVGYVITGYLTLIFSLFLPLSPLFLFFIFGITCIFSWRRIQWLYTYAVLSCKELGSWGPKETVLLILIGIFTVFYGISVFVPPYRIDALAYHLPETQAIAEGNILTIGGFGNFLSNTPKLVETIYAAGYAVGGHTVIHLIHYGIVMIFFILVYGWVRKMYSRSAALYSLLGFFSLYELMVNATNAYVDAACAVYQVAAIIFLLLFIEKKQRQYLVIAGIFFGAALSIKYIAFYGGVLALYIFIVGGYRFGVTIKEQIKNIVLFGLVSLSVAFFWYIKNWIYVDNPLYPFFFGHAGIADADFNAAAIAVKQYMPRTLKQYLLLPWGHFGEGYYLPVFGAFLLLPLSFFIDKQKKIVRLLGTMVIIYFTMWFFIISHQKRFAMLGLLLLMLVIGITIAWLEERYIRFFHTKWFISLIIVCSLLGGYSIVTHKQNYLVRTKKSEITYIAGVSDRQDFYAERGLGPVYGMSNFINEQFKDTVFLSLWNDPPFFLSHNNQFIPPDEYIKQHVDEISTTTIKIFLEEQGILYVVGYTDEAKNTSLANPMFKENSAEIDYMQRILRHVIVIEDFLPEIGVKVYENEGRIIYRIK